MRSRTRGSVSVLMVTGVLVLCLTALMAADLGVLLLMRSRAQAAADAAALAAVVEQVAILGGSGDPQGAAAAVARDNGARLTDCACENGETTARVAVEVRPALTIMRPWFDRAVHAAATAAVDPDVLSYRDPG